MSFSTRSLVMVTFVVFLGAFGSGCGGNACDDAGDKYAECFPSNGNDPPPDNSASGDQTQGECSGNTECVANCVTAASCSDMKAAITGEENDYTRCAAKCR
jgi:hypothetical protein